MITFSNALKDWGTPMFADALQREIKSLNIDQLLLQQALVNGSHALDEDISLIVLSIVVNTVKDNTSLISAKIGIFYTSMIPGCQCSDDPSPMNVESEYCELLFEIDQATANTQITLLS